MEINLTKLKKDYSELAVKYKLPGFKEMNEEFDIEKLAEHETETLLREVRKLMVDKSLAYLRFIEMFLNPSAAPILFFALLKGLDQKDKKLMEELYDKLGRIEIKVISIDNDYSEKSEADFLKFLWNEWKNVKEGMRKVSKALEESWEKKYEAKEKSYLG